MRFLWVDGEYRREAPYPILKFCILITPLAPRPLRLRVPALKQCEEPPAPLTGCVPLLRNHPGWRCAYPGLNSFAPVGGGETGLINKLPVPLCAPVGGVEAGQRYVSKAGLPAEVPLLAG